MPVIYSGRASRAALSATAYAGCIPPGMHRYETEYMDGRKQTETFEVDEEGRVKNLKIWVEDPQPAESKPKKREARTHKTPATKRRPVRRDQ